MAKTKVYYTIPENDQPDRCPVCHSPIHPSKLNLAFYAPFNDQIIVERASVPRCNTCGVPFLTKTEAAAIEKDHPGYHLELKAVNPKVSRPYLQQLVMRQAPEIKNLPTGTTLYYGYGIDHPCGTAHLTEYYYILHGKDNQTKIMRGYECQQCRRIILYFTNKYHLSDCTINFPKYRYIPDTVKPEEILDPTKTIHLMDPKGYQANTCPGCAHKLDKEQELYVKSDEYPDLRQKKFKACPRCHQLFAKPQQFEHQTFSEYKIEDIFLRKAMEANNRIVLQTGDFLTRSNLKHCQKEGHSLEDIKARVPITKPDGTIATVDIPAVHCHTCQKLYLLESEYQKLNQKGIPLCAVVEQEYWRNPTDKEKDWQMSGKSGSTLWVHGYNVNHNKNLSHAQRKTILTMLLQDEILTKAEITSHLDSLISRAGHRNNWENAREKWIQDRNFVSNYNADVTTIVNANSITHKTYHTRTGD